MGKGQGKGEQFLKAFAEFCLQILKAFEDFACCTFLVFGVSALGLLCLGVAKIVIGAIYLHDCTIEDKIPIFLIVGALTPMYWIGLLNWYINQNENLGVWAICGITGFLFHIAWLIAGSVWAYGTWFTVKTDTYVSCSQLNVAVPGCTEGTCNDFLLTFAFAMCTIDWILTGLGILLIKHVIMPTGLTFKIIRYIFWTKRIRLNAEGTRTD